MFSPPPTILKRKGGVTKFGSAVTKFYKMDTKLWHWFEIEITIWGAPFLEPPKLEFNKGR